MSADRARILVIGGTGNTGRRIAARLVGCGWAVRTASRGAGAPGTDHVRFGWADVSSHAAALEGVTRVYLVAPGLTEDPEGVMVPFVSLALERGARRFVLLSSSALPEDSPGLGAVARFLRASAPEWTVLEPSWFMQNFFDPGNPLAASLLHDDVIATSTGQGRVPFVDVDDIAEVAVRALADATSHDTAHVITGPQAMSYDDVASVLARVTRRPIRHQHISDEEARLRLIRAGVPTGYAELLVGLDAGIRDGAEDRVTDTVRRVTGRPPRAFEASRGSHRREDPFEVRRGFGCPQHARSCGHGARSSFRIVPRTL